MPLALIPAGQLSPEIRLAQAISDFERDLTSEQKLQIRGERGSPPAAEDVMRATAELDKKIFATGIKRGYGPRLTNFLDGVQKFVPIGDTLIGGTQGYLGRGVWTVVRISILSSTGAIIQHSAYVDRLTGIFMEAGRSMPRHQSMALLFPQSKALQTYLIEYFIVVVKLCHKIRTMFQNSALRQLLDSFINPLDDLESQLKTWSVAIKDEIIILTAALIRLENEENNRFRLLSQREDKRKESKRKHKRRLDILDKLSSYDHQTIWKQTRKEGNTNLHLDDEHYQHWKSSPISCTHIFSGKLGSGKSVLLANVVDDLYLIPEPSKHLIAYFFCHHRHSHSLKASTILGSIARQLIETILHTENLIELCPQGTAIWTIEAMTTLLSAAYEKTAKLIYVVIDGLDDCDLTEQDLVLKTMEIWQRNLRILLCISARWEPEKFSNLKLARLISPTVFHIPEDNPEITAYIDSEIDHCISTGRISFENEDLVSISKQVLASKSQGMFLWVNLSIKALCNTLSDEEVMLALQNLPLPHELPKLYARLLDKHSGSHKLYQNTILQLIVIAFRPLNIQEMREILSVEPGVMEWDSTKLIKDMPSLLGRCGGVVIVDEEELTVRLVHGSARQFLVESTSSSPHCFTTYAAERAMAQRITTYLNYVVFDTRVSTKLVPKIAARPMVNHLLTSTANSTTAARPFVRMFSRDSGKGCPDIAKTLADAAMCIRAKSSLKRDFENYAKTYWFQHSAAVLDEDLLTQNLVQKLLEKGYELTWDAHQIQNPLAWSVACGFAAALRLILEGNSSVERQNEYLDRNFEEALISATEKSLFSVIHTFLQFRGLVRALKRQDKTGTLFELLLWRAFMQKQVDLVELLLDQNVFSKAYTDSLHMHFYQSLALSMSWTFTDARLYEVLLKSGQIDINDTIMPGGMTPLQQATWSNRADLAELLLSQENIQVNQKCYMGRTALWYAACTGNPEVAKMLLRSGKTDVNLRCRFGHTPLHQAAYGGHMHVCHLLMEDPRIDLNAKTESNETALLLALRQQHRDVAELILRQSYLDNSIDLESPDSSGRTALSWAASCGNLRIIEWLIELSSGHKGLYSRCRLGRTPLSYAAQANFFGCVEALLHAHGGYWRAKDHTDTHGKTPIEHCILNQESSEVQSLLKRTKFRQ